MKVFEFLRLQIEETLVLFAEGLRWSVMTLEYLAFVEVAPVLIRLGPFLIALAVLSALVNL